MCRLDHFSDSENMGWTVEHPMMNQAWFLSAAVPLGAGDENVQLQCPALGAWLIDSPSCCPPPPDLLSCLHWVHNFGGLLPAWWGHYFRTPPTVYLTWGLSTNLAGSFVELLCDLRLFPPNFPSWPLFFHECQNYISLWSLFLLSPAPSPWSFTGVSPVNLLNVQSCLLLGRPKPRHLGFGI